MGLVLKAKHVLKCFVESGPEAADLNDLGSVELQVQFLARLNQLLTLGM